MSKFCPILGTLGYVLSKDQKKVLMLHRNACKDDAQYGKYNGLGGKVEPNEDVYTGMKREIFEESGLEVLEMKLRGTIIWTGFNKNHESWMGFLFLVTSYQNKPHTHCREGSLEWVPVNKIRSLPIWEGDHFFLDMIFDNNEKLFHGNMSYDGSKMKNFSYTRV